MDHITVPIIIIEKGRYVWSSFEIIFEKLNEMDKMCLIMCLNNIELQKNNKLITHDVISECFTKNDILL